MSAYFISLARVLDQYKPKWRDNHVLVLDNCSSQKTILTKTILKNLGFSVLLTAPASFKAMPIELAFAAIKRRDYIKLKTRILINDNSE